MYIYKFINVCTIAKYFFQSRSNTDTLWYDIDAVHKNQDSLPQSTVIQLLPSGGAMKLLLYNSLTHARQSVVRLRVSTPWVEVRDATGSALAAQVSG